MICVSATCSLPQGGFDSLLQPGNCSSENLDLLSTIKSEQHALMSSNIAHDETAQGFHDDDGILGNTPDFLEQFTDLSSYSNVSGLYVATENYLDEHIRRGAGQIWRKCCNMTFDWKI